MVGEDGQYDVVTDPIKGIREINQSQHCDYDALHTLPNIVYHYEESFGYAVTGSKPRLKRTKKISFKYKP